jgi:GT2 family glycosyltransferase
MRPDVVMRPDVLNQADLAVVIVSHNDGRWLEPCLSSVFAHAGGARLDVVVVDADSGDGTRELVESRFKDVRVITVPNRGFASGNNRGLEVTTAPYVLFLNPDTEVREGTFRQLLGWLDRRPEVGLVGVRQFTPDGELFPTIRRFPNAARALGEALRSERWPVAPSWGGERVLDRSLYAREQECDWTSGSFMLARRAALHSSGMLDERFFLYSEEPDLCLRFKRDGWKVLHLPSMSIMHHACKGGIRPRMTAQELYARRQYARKHFSPPHRCLYLAALALRHVVGAWGAGSDSEPAARREASLLALRTLAGRAQPPFGPPPATAAPAATQPSALGGAGRKLATGSHVDLTKPTEVHR